MPKRWPKPTGGMKSGPAPNPPSLPMPHRIHRRQTEARKIETNTQVALAMWQLCHIYTSRAFGFADIISDFT